MTESQYIPNTDRNARGILDVIVEAKRIEVAALQPKRADLRDRAHSAPPTRDFAAALRGPTVRIIAEFKRRSPSAGWIREDAKVGAIARAYETFGAAALSILTDREFFGGTLADLEEGRKLSRLPILRKDFVIDEIQLLQARAAGADAALLIVRILADNQLRELLQFAQSIGLDVLVETHNEAEVDRAVAAGANIIGVNNRDLSTFRTNPKLVLDVLPRIPHGAVVVAESGIRDKEMIERYGAAGIDAVLIGETLMRDADSMSLLSSFGTVPRGSRV